MCGNQSDSDGMSSDIERHAELAGQQTPREVKFFQHGRQTLIVRDWNEFAQLYKTAGGTKDFDEMDTHDGPVLIDGQFRHVVEDDGFLIAHHPYGGRMEIIAPGRTINVPAMLLTEVPRIDE